MWENSKYSFFFFVTVNTFHWRQFLRLFLYKNNFSEFFFTICFKNKYQFKSIDWFDKFDPYKNNQRIFLPYVLKININLIIKKNCPLIDLTNLTPSMPTSLSFFESRWVWTHTLLTLVRSVDRKKRGNVHS